MYYYKSVLVFDNKKKMEKKHLQHNKYLHIKPQTVQEKQYKYLFGMYIAYYKFKIIFLF